MVREFPHPIGTIGIGGVEYERGMGFMSFWENGGAGLVYHLHHHLPVVKGVVSTPLFIDQPMGKGPSMEGTPELDG